MNRVPRLVTLLALLSMPGIVSLSGCASQQDFSILQAQVQQQSTQQRNLQQRTGDMEAQLRQIQNQIQDIDKRLKTVQQLSTQNTSAQSAQANMWSEMESLRVQLSKIQGDVDTLNRDSQLAQQQGVKPEAVQALAQDVENIKAALQSQLAIDVDKPTKEEKSSKNKQANDPAQALYDRAYESYKKSNYLNAQSMWAEFVQSYPKHELVSNAIFWQGECFFQLGDFARAVLSYQDVITKYPKSNKAPAAMLKQGIAFKKIGKDKAGDLVLQELIKKYPNSAEAKRAKSFK